MNSDATQILIQIEAGDAEATEQLLPLVYQELRRLAAEIGHLNLRQLLGSARLSTRCMDPNDFKLESQDASHQRVIWHQVVRDLA